MNLFKSWNETCCVPASIFPLPTPFAKKMIIVANTFYTGDSTGMMDRTYKQTPL